MPLPPSVFLLGHDAQLVQARRSLLEDNGFEVYTATHSPALYRALESHRVDLLILCQSLTAEECDRAVSLVTECQPKVEVLALVAATTDSTDEVADVETNSETGLKSLVGAIGAYLKERVKPRAIREEFRDGS
jgi:DNA-binding response OmpR family regulator